MADFLYDLLIIDGVHHEWLPSMMEFDMSAQAVPVKTGPSANLTEINTTLRSQNTDYATRALRRRRISLTWSNFGGMPTLANECLVDQLKALHSLQRGFYVYFDNQSSRDGELLRRATDGHFYTALYPAKPWGWTPYGSNNTWPEAITLTPPLGISPGDPYAISEELGIIEVPGVLPTTEVRVKYSCRFFCVIDSVDFNAVPNTFSPDDGTYVYTGSVVLREIEDPGEGFVEPWPIYCGNLPKSDDSEDDEEIFPPPVPGYDMMCYEIVDSANSIADFPHTTLQRQHDFTYSLLAGMLDGSFIRKITEQFTLGVDSPYFPKDEKFTVTRERVYNTQVVSTNEIPDTSFTFVMKADKLGGYLGTAATSFNDGTDRFDWRFITPTKLRTMLPNAIMSPGVLFDHVIALMTTDVWEAEQGTGSPDMTFGAVVKTGWAVKGKISETVTFFDTALREEHYASSYTNMVALDSFTNGGAGYIQKATHKYNTVAPLYYLGTGVSLRTGPSAASTSSGFYVGASKIKLEWTNPNKPMPEYIDIVPKIRWRQALVLYQPAATAYNRTSGFIEERAVFAVQGQQVELYRSSAWANNIIPGGPNTLGAFSHDYTQVNGVNAAFATYYDFTLTEQRVYLDQNGVGYYTAGMALGFSRAGESVSPLTVSDYAEEKVDIFLMDANGDLITTLDYGVCVEYQKLKPAAILPEFFDHKSGATYTNDPAFGVPDTMGDVSDLEALMGNTGAYSFATSIGGKYYDFSDSYGELINIDPTDWITGGKVVLNARRLVNEDITLYVVFDIGGTKYTLGTITVGAGNWASYSVGDYYVTDIIDVIGTASNLSALNIHLLAYTASAHSTAVVEVEYFNFVAFAADVVV